MRRMIFAAALLLASTPAIADGAPAPQPSADPQVTVTVTLSLSQLKEMVWGLGQSTAPKDQATILPVVQSLQSQVDAQLNPPPAKKAAPAH